ncbi:hypothetical protein [Bremerella alba]|uniref:Carboxypeptidase regulatory-like domain-containing protein n=1 Tax=Bremerella alba TaxID=980252 RepID=A0A7V8V3F7_9BACT|nr:hypothetical protein [Bremerella alba]MBA2114195.1 hypothetical protein [Bremerella alba]
MKRFIWTTIPYLFLVALLTGCGQAGPETGQVSGTVTYNGKTLPAGTIVFIPEKEGSLTAYAEIQEDGTYVAGTEAFGPGVPLGKHRVMISAFIDHGPEKPVEAILPEKFSSDRKSGLTVDVEPGDNVVDFPL